MPEPDSAVLETPEVEAPSVVEEPVVTETTEEPSDETKQVETAKPADGQQPSEELKEFDTSAGARLREMVKKAPELNAVLAKYPDLKNSIAAAFKIQAATRELFTNVAEMRELRQALPNGIADIKAMETEIAEVEELDRNTYAKSADGKFPGHAAVVENIHKENPEAFDSLIDAGLRHWSKVNPEAYSNTLSQIIGSTLQSERVFGHLQLLSDAAQASGDAKVIELVKPLKDFLDGFQPGQRRELSPEAKKIQQDRQALQTERQKDTEAKGAKFTDDVKRGFSSLRRKAIEDHRLIKALPASINPQKKERMLQDIVGRITEHLKNTPRFMGPMKRAFASMNLDEVLKLEKAAFSQQWLINQYVRKVLEEETPNLVTAKTAGSKTAQPAAPRTSTSKNGSKPAYKVGKNWFHGNGTPMTTSDVIKLGLHGGLA